MRKLFFALMFISGSAIADGGLISGTGGGSGGGGGTGGGGTVIASPQNQVPRYSGSGSTTTLTGASNLTNDGTTVSVIGSGGLSTTYNISAGSITITGPGNFSFINAPDVNTYQVVGSSTTPTNGHVAIFSSSWSVIDGGVLGSAGVTSVNASANPAITGNVTLLAGSNVTLSQSGSTVTIASSGGGGGSGGYNLQPATVTIQAAQGITISSAITVSLPSKILAGAGPFTITSTMSVVEASAPVNGDSIVINLPSAASFPGLDLMIYKVDGGTGAVVINGAGSDLIESTGTIYLNAKFQHASLHSLGAVGWGSGLGGIQATPARLYATQFTMHNQFSVGTSSGEIACPITVPVPLIVTGYTYVGQSAPAGSKIAIGFLDANGNVVISAGPIAMGTGKQTITQTTATLSPGAYFLVVQIIGAGTMDGGDASSGSVPGCISLNLSTSGIYALTPASGAIGAGTTPGISVNISGGTWGL